MPKERAWDSIIVGRPIIENIDIDINTMVLRIPVELISIVPESLYKALGGRSQIMVWGGDLPPGGFEDEIITSSLGHTEINKLNETRKLKAKEFFKNHLLTFTVESIRTAETQKVYFNGKNVQIHEIPENNYTKSSYFTPIPIISSNV